MDKINEKRRKHYDCFCGGCYQQRCKSEHFRTILHQSVVQNIKQVLVNGQKQIEIADDLLNEVKNIKPLKIKTL